METEKKSMHTQGEWSLVKNLNKPGDFCVHSGGLKICEIATEEMSSKQSMANAKLLASSKSLLEVAEMALDYYEKNDMGQSIVAITTRNVIKQATE